ncbi:MAG TPA: amidohydrolase [Thermoanaerobaculia bacterium]|nr:amidohydrolase [Thermoanaerobaculia bacterium]
MKKLALTISFTLLMIGITSCATRQGEFNDLVIAGGTIVTGTGAGVIERGGLVIRDGRILFVGTAEEALRRSNGTVLDAHGLTILPGLIDAHAHVEGLGSSLETVALQNTRSYDEVIARVHERAENTAAGEWILGRGWDQNDWAVKEFPTVAALDAAVPDHPVVVTRIDGHALLANSTAMRIGGVTRSTPDPAGGRILRSEQGEPSGVFIDNAMGLITRSIPPPSREMRKRRIENATAAIAATGLTGVHDAGVDAAALGIYQELADERALPIRIYAMLDDEPSLLSHWFSRGPLAGHGDRLTVRAVKLYADGALGSRGAALLETYSDDPGNSGLLVSTVEHLSEVARRADEAGFQIGIHAIGDRGVRAALDAVERAGIGPEDRPRIEHLQVIHLGDLPRLRALGLIASMQPTHATSDMPWAEARVGPERIRGAYAWRTLVENDIVLAFGSDFPVEEVSPLLGLYAAVTREDRNGNPPGGWYPAERLSPMEAIRAFTEGAAYAGFEEETRGTLEAGKAADLTILAENPLAVDPDRIDDIEVRYTIVGGEIVFMSRSSGNAAD